MASQDAWCMPCAYACDRHPQRSRARVSEPQRDRMVRAGLSLEEIPSSIGVVPSRSRVAADRTTRLATSPHALRKFEAGLVLAALDALGPLQGTTAMRMRHLLLAVVATVATVELAYLVYANLQLESVVREVEEAAGVELEHDAVHRST